MKKKLPLLVLSAIMLFGIASCGNKPSGSTGNNQTTSSIPVTVESVKVSCDTTNVLGGSKTNVSYNVTGSQTGLKVDWSTSDASVATVKNGTVKFENVTENKEVTITATSRDDATKSDSITFNVHHSPIDLTKSTGNELDYSTYLEDGIISHGIGGDPSLMFNGVYGTQWYVEAEITATGFAESENAAKYGIMTGTSENGVWMSAADNIKTAFYYVQMDRTGIATGWNTLGMVQLNSELNNWNWGKHVKDFTVSNDDKAVLDESFKLGLLRDGDNYFYFYGKGSSEEEQSTDSTMKCYGSAKVTTIAADEPSYAWIGGFQTSALIENVKTIVGEDVRNLYDKPTKIEFASDETLLYLGEQYKLSPTGDKSLFNYDAVTYTSSDDSIATVNANGVVTANSEKAGVATITAKYGELEATFKVHVSANPADKVTIDGLKDDLIYQNVSKYEFSLNGEGEHIDFYATKNTRGIYMFADIYVDKLKNGETHADWWQNDNFEVRFLTKDNMAANYQLWASGDGNSNFAQSSATFNSEKDSETGKYNATIEVFAEYKDLGLGRINKDEILGIRIGSNADSGWKSISWDWANNDFGSYYKLTKNGLVRSDAEIEAILCPDGEHNMTDWYVSKKVTCYVAGEEEQYCKNCGHLEHKVIEPKGEHTWWTKEDYDKLDIITYSTCTTHGTYTTSCKYCGEKLDTVYNDLPLDRSSLNLSSSHHDGEWVEDPNDLYGGHWSCCGSAHGSSITNDNKKSSGGWTERANWTDIATGLRGDFEFNAKWTVNSAFNGDDGNLLADTNDQQWRHPLLVVSDGDSSHWAEGAAYGDNATFRMDWFGWMDDRNGNGSTLADAQNNGVWYLGDGADFWTELKNIYLGGTIELNAKRVGNDLTLTYKFTGVNGYVYDGTDNSTLYEQKLTGLHTGILDFSLSAEYSSFTLNSVRLIEATEAE